MTEDRDVSFAETIERRLETQAGMDAVPTIGASVGAQSDWNSLVPNSV